MTLKRDYTGMRIGKLTALRPDPENDRKWIFRCDCGNEKSIFAYNVFGGHTQSCGCLSKKQATINGRAGIKDLTGQRFGKLVALRYLGRSKWELRCDCGNITTAHQSNLHKGQKTSCGCAVSLYKANRANIVEGTNIGSIRNKTLSKRNTSGVRGVHFCKSRQLWIATIGFQGKQYTLMASTNKDECVLARKEAEEAIFGDFLDWLESHNNKIKEQEEKK